MDCRGAAHALTQIANLLELHNEDRFTVRAMHAAARAVASYGEHDLALALSANMFAAETLAPASVAVLHDLAESNGSALLEQLQEETPEGLMEMLRVPGLGPARIRLIHEGLHLDTLQGLEQAARDGRLASLPKFGEKTAEKILKGIADLHATGAYVLWQHARAEAERALAVVRAHQDVLQVEIAGSIRRRSEVVRDIDLVAAVRGAPSLVAAGLVRSLKARAEDGVRIDLVCVRPEQFALAFWRVTGNIAHVRQVTERAAVLGLVLAGDELRGKDGALLPVLTERDLYAHLGLEFIVPEQREAAGEVEAALFGPFAPLVAEHDLAGALHCHSQYSDGGATIADMANAARTRGLRYLGISDHSQSNPYAGGLSRDDILRQHDEIDALNARYVAEGIDFRLLKGIEADILPCGRLDYDTTFLDRFDFVIGSVHTRYGMNERQMTDRVLKALDDPHLTILGHPTGRLLLTREPYAIDLDAVIAKAARVGVAVELNADPHRLDMDWRACRVAHAHGALVSIGPDAHSPQGLEHLEMGVAIARKGWLACSDVLNTRDVDAVLAFARARRVGAGPRLVPTTATVASR